MKTFTFDKYRLGDFKNNLTDLNKKLSTIGDEQIEILSIENFDVQEEKFVIEKVKVTVNELELNKIPNHTYLGFVSFKNDIPSIYAHKESNLSQLISKRLDNQTMTCDHCQVKRRRVSYHVFNDNNTGSVKIIGSSCAQKYYGYDIDKLLSVYENFTEDWNEEKLEYGSYQKHHAMVRLNDVIKVTAYNTEFFKETWTSGETGHWVTNTFTTRDKDLQKDYEEFVVKNDLNNEEKTNQIRQNIIDTFSSVDPSSSDFEFNIFFNLFDKDEYGNVELKVNVLFSRLGVVAWAIWKANQVQVDETKESNFVGDIKEKINISNVKLLGYKTIDTGYGWSMIITLQDEQGNYFKVFSSTGTKFSSSILELESNSIISIKGTIKDHIVDQYLNNKKVNLLTRVSLI